MIFNWMPTRILYVTDPLADRFYVLLVDGIRGYATPDAPRDDTR